MVRAVADIFILVTAIGGFAAFLVRTFFKRKAIRESNIEHIRQLEEENKEMDEALSKLRNGQDQ